MARPNSLPALSLAKENDLGATLEQCQICQLKGKRKNSSFFCISCSMYLCMSCQEQHKATDVTRDHQVTLKKQQDKHPKLCTVHKFANIQYYCDTCGKMICVNCTMIEHRGHAVLSLDKKYDQCQDIIKSTRNEVDSGISKIAAELQDSEDVVKALESARDEIKVEINAKVIALQQKIKLQQTQLLRSLNHHFDDKINSLSKQKDSLQRKKSDLTKLREVINRDMNGASEEAFIQQVMKMDGQVRKMSFDVEVKPDEIVGMAFVMTNNEELGKLEEKNNTLLSNRFKPLLKPGSKLRSSQRSLKTSVTSSALSESSTKTLRRVNALPIELKDARHWRKVRVMHSFKLSAYIEKLTGLALLPTGKMLIADGTSHGVILCDKTGKYQQRIMSEEMPYPSGVAANKDGQIIASIDKTVRTFKLGGTKIGEITMSSNPSAIAVDQQGNLFINDTKSRVVNIYSPEGKLVGKFNTEVDGTLPHPHVLSVGNNTVVLSYSMSELSHFVRTFSYSGQPMNTFELPSACHGALVDNTGNLILAAGGLCFVTALGSEEVASLVCVDRFGKQFKMDPHGLVFTPNGHVCTLHNNPVAKRSEIVYLQLGN